jgi:uncharacterized protein (TIGR02284 family)
METIEKAFEVLNDLIEINNDRVAGFAHAGKDLGENDNDLLALFLSMREESRNNVQELGYAINQAGGEPEMGFSGSGTLHRTWLDIKATFTGHDRKSILEECERGEDAIKNAYKSALDPENGLSPEFTEIVIRQKQGIDAAHDRIKALRDSVQ